MLREQLSLQEQRRQSDREWFEKQLENKQRELLEEFRAILQAISAQSGTVIQRFEEMRTRTLEKLDALYELAGVPQRDVPTIEELVEQAKADPTKRKVLEQTLGELEFADPIIGFN